MSYFAWTAETRLHISKYGTHTRGDKMRRFCSVIWFLVALATVATPVVSNAQIISITIAPPELPVYEQPPIPAPGYLWSPGYWAYGPDGYFWVPGTWVLPPQVGFLWTPGYWGWQGGIYVWSAGYWGAQIGFYGGINYGFGYGGVGYEGGYWNNGVFAYNRSVNNFGKVKITNVYNKTVISNPIKASFNGGTGGTTAKPTPQETAAANEKHLPATSLQTQHEQLASTNKALLVSENHGQPTIAATTKPGQFTGKGVVAAKGGTAGTTQSGTKPTGTGATSTNPAGTGTSEKMSPSGTDLGQKKGGTPPKPLNTETKPLGASPQIIKLNQLQPTVTTVPKPHPVTNNAPHPVKKPGAPPPPPG